MARQVALDALFDRILAAEPALTSADMLLEFAKRDPVGRHHRATRKDAAKFLEIEGRYQVYKRVPVEWAGRISKGPQTDTRFDLDL